MGHGTSLTGGIPRSGTIRTAKSILIVEDEPDLAELLRYNLQREGYEARCAPDGGTALAEVKRTRPDLVLLDRMLPGVSGDDVIAQLKREPSTASIPVIMLTAKAEEGDELVGFALGADDYVGKPFSMKLLVARVRAIFRRGESLRSLPEVMVAGPIGLDNGRHEITVNGESVPMTATEFRLLKSLLAADGRVLSRSQLIDSALGQGVAVTDRTIDVHITSLRRKLGEAADWVQTVRGVGYTLRDPQ